MISRFLRFLGHILGELRLLGWKGACFRIVFELRRRLGIDVLLRRPVHLNIERYLSLRPKLPRDAQAYLEQWRWDRFGFGIVSATEARPLLKKLLSDPKKVRARALAVREDRFVFFRKSECVFEGGVSWFNNPGDGAHWPSTHSSRLLLNPVHDGDIKLVWEIGRFAWAVDLVRAWLVDGDDGHLDVMFNLIDDFGAKNPLYVGPQWVSEQEVAIRARMLIFVQEVLAESPNLTGERLQRLHALLELHGCYLERGLGYAEFAIRNNHLIHGALGLYAVGHALPCHPKASSWCSKAESILFEAVKEQWYEDGGYVQPSHNYHRSAWHGMLLARSIALDRGNTSLVNAITARAVASLDFFLAQMDPVSGRLPNWGPNDGALVGVWTECDFADFRPLIQSLAYLAGRELPFEEGPWDEELLWVFGSAALLSSRRKYQPQSRISFSDQGLHVLRHTNDKFAVLRCGSVRSRYGQQADQLHIDLWQAGRNLALDAGSYNYNKNPAIHNWFRGTASHNTILVEDLDQMVPVRRFKYIHWTRAEAQVCELDGVQGAVIGVHHGYTRLSGRWGHARMLARLADAWVVVDRVWPMDPGQAKPVSIRLHWQLAPGVARKTETGLWLEASPVKCHLSFAAGDGKVEFQLAEGSNSPIDGWSSRYYNHRQPVPAVNLTACTSREHWFASVFAARVTDVRFDIDGKKLVFEDSYRVPLNILQRLSTEMLGQLLH